MKSATQFSKALRLRIYTALTSLMTVIGSGTFIFHRLEDWSWAESFYFSVVTVTTVGYGDLHPTSDKSRITAAVFILISVAIVATALGSIGSIYAERREKIVERRTQQRTKNQK